MGNEVTKINTNRQIKQSNNLCEARYKLTKYEQRMVIAICSQIDDRKEELPIIKVKATDLADFCEFDKSKKYTMVKTTARTLRSRTLEYQTANGDWYVTGWINSAYYNTKDSTITFTFDERLKPELLKLKSAYLLTPTEPLMKFDRDYSVRLYFILKKMLKIKDFEYSLDYFRDRFQLGKGYKLFANLKNKVLEPALDEINKKSDISVWHEYIKEGRAHTKIHFIVDLKENNTANERSEQPQQITSSATTKTEKTKFEDFDDIDELQVFLDEVFSNINEDTPVWTPRDEPEEPEQKTQDNSAGQALLKSLGVNPPSSSALTDATEKKEKPAPAPSVVAEAEKETTTADRGEVSEWSEEQQADYDRMLQYGVWAQTAKKYVITYDHALIERNIQGCVKSNIKGNIKDLGAVIVNAIANDTYKGEEELQKALERDKKRKKAEWEQSQKEIQAKHQAETDKIQKLAEIRAKKSRDEIIAVFENVMAEYNRNKILTPEMVAELEKNGIPQKDFISYTREITRKTIKYLQ